MTSLQTARGITVAVLVSLVLCLSRASEGSGISIARPPTVAGVLPDYSHDYYVEDFVDQLDNSDSARDRRYDNIDVPDRCRTDLCEAESTRDYRKGIFAWPSTPLGMRVFLRCPYSLDVTTYAYRDCSWPGPSNKTAWGLWLDLDHCPDPPLAQLREKLQKEPTTYSINGGHEVVKARYTEVTLRLADVITTYGDAPILSEDAAFVQAHIDRFLAWLKQQQGTLSNEAIRALVQVYGALIGASFLVESDPATRFLDVVPLLAHMVTVPDGEQTVTIVTPSVDMRAILVGDIDGETKVPLSYARQVEGQQSQVASVDVNLVTKQGTGARNTILYVTHIDIGQIGYTPELSPTSKAFALRGKRALDDDLTLSTPNYALGSHPGLMEDLNIGLANYSLGRHVFYISTNAAMDSSSSAVRVEVTYRMEMDTEIVTVAAECASLYDAGDQNVARASTSSRTWYIDNCGPATVHQSKYLQCSCISQGFFGAFIYGQHFPPTAVPTTSNDRGTSLSEFLGFPFVYELYVIEHVLRAISLVCLLLTLVSYALFSKTRHGTPTRVLLHLCVTLTLLLILLYVTDQVAGSRLGCRVSSVLRFYLVMTSLMWNGVEAVNMYLMLVKIFKSTVTHFVWKAAIAAYGLPALVIAITMLVDMKAFDGTYDRECYFTCRLKDNTLYFAYLLPMGLIICHNMVIFGLVIRTLLQHNHQIHAGKKQGSLRSHWLRLLGAVSMMVLLGVPWVFSAFGAIDATKGSGSLALLEGIFSVIFVVCYNLQGVFIFIFHCARNADVRKSWRSTLSTLTQTLHSTSSNNHSAEGRG